MFFSLKHLDRSKIDVSAWCKRDGPIQQLYEEAGIKSGVYPDMPKVSGLPRTSRNVVMFGLFAVDWLMAKGFRDAFYDALDGVDLVHFNHEALFWLARDMKRRKPKPAAMHIRTNIWRNIFAKHQSRIVAENTDARIFITENERETMSRNAGFPVDGDILHNIVEPSPLGTLPWELDDSFAHRKSFLVGCLSNYAWLRGTDRLIDLAVLLKKAGRDDIGFVVAGNVNLTRSLPGLLGRIARQGGGLDEYARQCGVADMFTFTGHVSEPERILAAVDAVIKPTREANPWGRDILEAMAAGKPVISVGRYDRFVETGATGILQPHWDVGALVDAMAQLADNEKETERMASLAKDRVAEYCDGPTQSEKLEAIWRRVAETS
ncbi:MAG: glycosyltransferase family 4 protein [Rhodospirillaceae bacterium]|nr:glycosyltransferase family 4 protein [Rhodospirillaceae bacterium]MBT5667376.1 glycosyltransferase family 4 protein [Rhodospirillaceae bacterium]MBT5811123.1 glycosyltransferase family 4 protein [Rhodospirillaceae bacterium]